jgi:hypothetical protein
LEPPDWQLVLPPEPLSNFAAGVMRLFSNPLVGDFVERLVRGTVVQYDPQFAGQRADHCPPQSRKQYLNYTVNGTRPSIWLWVFPMVTTLKLNRLLAGVLAEDRILKTRRRCGFRAREAALICRSPWVESRHYWEFVSTNRVKLALDKTANDPLPNGNHMKTKFLKAGTRLNRSDSELFGRRNGRRPCFRSLN